MATLQELQDVYTLEDAMNLWEILAVRNHQERESMEEARRGR